MTGNNIRGSIDDYDDDANAVDYNSRQLRVWPKYNAAQKRQTQRDKNRFNPGHPSFNPTRNQGQEDHERRRKHNQANVSGRRRRDAYEPFVPNAGLGNPTYARRREVARANREAATGGARDANYHALDWNTADGAWDWDPIHSRRYEPVNYGTGLWP